MFLLCYSALVALFSASQEPSLQTIDITYIYWVSVLHVRVVSTGSVQVAKPNRQLAPGAVRVSVYNKQVWVCLALNCVHSVVLPSLVDENTAGVDVTFTPSFHNMHGTSPPLLSTNNDGVILLFYNSDI